MKLKICKIGNSLGASFPKEVLDKLQVGEGDTIYVTETPDGVQLTTYDPEFEQIMEAASQVTRRYRNALRELAK
ncbi:MAG: AbrB/MazE/SpoVT family DNA-binding domain-containing protein [Microcystis aeruginosa]|jgi:putative addiction module antidote|uniref:AbrB/MazE/SpoVT family DNA-binding domain-containing protein n=1 Tax=Microcystis aeruginosa Ma_MB_S_20031200_S102 TaxID=2486254 RepID=A0A552E9V7_MICAE|nr:AbrB/MazE/SpoVT family DNA-binding domain-containing protein [Microcystis sp. LE19-338.1B]MCZ8358805.1 AbrB/MazE/SpoVT family DNA-binding domain-containing protein [Microcystis sp. LE19-388.1G]NCS28205.1 AbrB/MazE/SpoVT family DNA-binding domain-containing protein [Microcystis aeruginosa F13-15]TRU23465.1 MAG: AbrB/MazE/SpoVT family DNA-binding domain-containing protein [Microcystis aeruginosa Ma_MB_S_20031200_S102D]TRU31242.1 MAG: AbrB/MazE/SpoVT family DNA-binding domain-containing protein